MPTKLILCEFFDRASGLCMYMYQCDQKGHNLQCVIRGVGQPRKAAPLPPPLPSRKPASAPKAQPRKAAPAKPGPRKDVPPENVAPKGTMAECANGSEGFYYKGICLGGEHDPCEFQTDLRFPVKSASPIFQNRKFTKCFKYGITRCPAGDASLYHPKNHVCLATGKAKCPHQVLNLMVPLENGKDYAYCDRYEKK